MSSTPSSSASIGSGGRRNVVLALHSEFGAIRSGIYDQARRAGWRVRDLRYFGMRIPRPCPADGVLLYLRPDETSLARQLLRLNVPVVQFETHVLSHRTCCVVPDQRALGQAAARHFADRGFRNMAYLHAETFANSTFRTIAEAFVEEARALGAKAELFAVQRPGDAIPWTRFGTLTKRFEKEISKLALPLGIFTYLDVMAVRICQFCEAIGLSVPEQIAVLGLGNNRDQCEFAPTLLSSADPNFYEQGRAAAELLERLMNGEPAPEGHTVIAPAGIVTRQSTDVLALPDIETARGLRYMWEHLAEPLSVDDIAAAAAISRRKLERHFRAHLHRSVTEELIRKRIERGCELLRGTDLSVKDIAGQVGFRSEPYFFVVFRKVMKMTPRQYRLAHDAESQR